MIELSELNLNDIVPSNLLEDKSVISILEALSPEGLQISNSISQAIIYARIDELPEDVLDMLAYQFHVDFYDLARTLEMKREAVKGSLLWHMKKGPEWAILKALEMIGIEGEFLHWIETGDEPYSFRIKAKITGSFYMTQGRDKLISTIRRAVMESKAARSYFKGLKTEISFKEESQIYAGVFDALMGFEIIGLAPVGEPDLAQVYAGLACLYEGIKKIQIAHAVAPDTQIYAGLCEQREISQDIGVESDEMQELLLKFEERIFKRIDEMELRMTTRIEEHEAQTTRRLDEILELLRWKDADEEL